MTCKFCLHWTRDGGDLSGRDSGLCKLLPVPERTFWDRTCGSFALRDHAELVALVRRVEALNRPALKPEPKPEFDLHDFDPWLDGAILDAPVAALGLGGRAINGLRNELIDTIGEVILYSEKELLDMRDFGRKSLATLKSALAVYGLRLAGGAWGK